MPEGVVYSSGKGGAGMFGLGFSELLLILVIVLVIFGAGRLPELGNSLGKGIRNFKKAIKEPDAIDVTPDKDKEKDKPEK
jgi:sec-independent protein translocase protein TatA